MKILAASDLHGNLDGLDLSGIDLALFAGDIAPLRSLTYWAVRDQLSWMNIDFYSFCNRWPATKIVFIPGNHDFFPIIDEAYGYSARDDASIRLTSNATMLIDSKVDLPILDSEKSISIYGTPWVPIISHRWAFEAESIKLQQKFGAIPDGIDILLTHTPPKHGTLGVSLDYGEDSDNFGCSELRDAILQKKPSMCFCGHIHSGDHSMNAIGSSRVYNVSRLDERYKIVYEPLVFNWIER